MSISNELRDHLAPLFIALADGTINDEQTEALRAILRDDADARRYYAHYIFVHASLAWQETQPIIEQAASQELEIIDPDNTPVTTHHSPVTTHRSPISWDRFLSRHRQFIGLAAGLLFVVAVLSWAAVTYFPGLAHTDESSDEKAAEEAAFIAKLVDWRGVGGDAVQWLDGTRPPLTNPRLLPGTRLAISAGLLEIKYNTGATVIVEGPAEFIVGQSGERKAESGNTSHDSLLTTNQDNSGFLVRGQLVARCETAESKGFTIETPKLTVTDLGTEFAMRVSERSDAKVHVYQGTVSTVSYKSDGSIVERMLRQNESVEVAANGETSAVVQASEEFATYARRLPGSIQLPSGLEQVDYREVVLADKPVAYWPLDDRTDQVLTDVVGSRVATPHGAIVSPNLDDKQREPATLLFDGQRSYASAAYDAQLNTAAFSIEAWAKPRAPQGGYRAVVSNRQDDLLLGLAGYVLYVTPNNRWELWLGTSSGPNRGNDWQKLVGPEARVARWTHVAATFEPDGEVSAMPITGTAKLYVDGRLVAAEKKQFRTNTERGFFLGGVLEQNKTPKYHFDGNLAHLAVYDRVFSDADVRRHYGAAHGPH